MIISCRVPKEIKQEIGSASSQTRNPFAVTNHLQFVCWQQRLHEFMPNDWIKRHSGSESGDGHLFNRSVPRFVSPLNS